MTAKGERRGREKKGRKISGSLVIHRVKNMPNQLFTYELLNNFGEFLNLF